MEMKKRFKTVFKQTDENFLEGHYRIIVDQATGVNYLCWTSDDGASITPLLDQNGRPIVTETETEQ